MNVLYRAIATKILLCDFMTVIRTVREKPKMGFADLRRTPEWDSFRPEHRALIGKVFQAVREGVPDEEIKTEFFATFMTEVLGFMRSRIASGKFRQDELQGMYDRNRTRPGMQDLSERDFYLFVAHTACQP